MNEIKSKYEPVVVCLSAKNPGQEAVSDTLAKEHSFYLTNIFSLQFPSEGFLLAKYHKNGCNMLCLLSCLLYQLTLI